MKKKRILALVLSICLLASCWPVEKIKAETDASAIENENTSTYYLNGEKAILYDNNYFLASQEKYNSALGSEHPQYFTLSENNTLISTGTASSDIKNAIFNGFSTDYIKSFQNYTVTADIVTTQTTGNVAIMTYSSCAANQSTSTGYEFNILGTTNGQTFRLNRRINGSVYSFAPIAGNNAGVAVTEFFEDYTSGKKITISISTVTNADGNVVLNCYATFKGVTKTIFENIVDNTDKKVTSGAPGLKINKINATVKNISVTSQDGGVIYQDDFASEAKYNAAMGDYSAATYKVPWVANGLVLSEETNGQYNAIFNGIQSYVVSADLVTSQTTGYAAVLTNARSTNTTTNATVGYEFAILGAKEQTFRLYRRQTSQAGHAILGAATPISSFFESDGITYTPGTDTVTLSLSTAMNADGNVVLNCYATIQNKTKVIFENIVDDSSYKLIYGAPGLKANRQGVTVSNLSVAVKSAAPAYVYKDDFTVKNTFEEALSEASMEYGNNYVWENGKLTLSGTKISLFKGIDRYASLQNYTAEADFVYPAGDTKFNGIMVYGDGAGQKSDGYEFAVVAGKFRLYRRDDTNKNHATLAGNTNEDKVSAVFTNYTEGTELKIKLSLTAITNADESVTLTCKAKYGNEEKVIFSVTDNSSYKYVSGTVGLRGTTVGGTVDNLCVKKVTNSFDLTGIEYMNMKENQSYLYGLSHVGDTYARMDTSVAQEIAGSTNFSKTSVYTHARESSGGRIRINTNSPYVTIKATYPSYVEDYAPLMGAGKVGFDVYVDTEEGSTYYGTIAPTDLKMENSSWTYEGIVEFPTEESRNLTIYFPITNEVSEVYLGVKEDATVGENTKQYEDEAPIVYYGSSITQGGNATKPGNTYVNTIGRMIHRDYLNLGMWGSCHGETRFAEYIANLDMSIFVFDYDHNAGSASELTERHEAFYNVVRNAHPDLPIVFISRPNQVQEDWEECRTVIQTTYNNAVASGDKNVYFIDGQSFFANEEGCLDEAKDKVHPTDKGQKTMAEKIGSLLKNIIQENYYDVSLYRSGEVMEHPTQEGKVFAGWYSDQSFTKASALGITDKEGWAYAKFVDKEVLSAVVQLPYSIKDADVAAGTTTSIRFVSTVDCDHYLKVGFYITAEGGKTIEHESTNIYSKIVSKTEGLEFNHTPDEFSDESTSFITYSLINVPVNTKTVDKRIDVTPYWVTADGTLVEGVTRNKDNNPITLGNVIEAYKEAASASPYSSR